MGRNYAVVPELHSSSFYLRHVLSAIMRCAILSVELLNSWEEHVCLWPKHYYKSNNVSY